MGTTLIEDNQLFSCLLPALARPVVHKKFKCVYHFSLERGDREEIQEWWIPPAQLLALRKG